MNMVGVRFGRLGRVHYLDPSNLDLHVQDRVLVEQENGTREATVVIEPRQFMFSELRGPMFRVREKLDPEP